MKVKSKEAIYFLNERFLCYMLGNTKQVINVLMISKKLCQFVI